MYENLFEPLNLGSVTVPNRIARGAHNVGLPWVDQSDAFIAYHEERAKGGVGLIVLGIAGVHATSPTGIPVTHDKVIGGYEKIASRLHPHGTKVFQQLWHAGSARAFPGTAPWSASDVPNPHVGVSPIPMTKAMIDDVVESFAAAARRVKEGGLDGIELHGAHGYLIGQFLSPATNHRTDEYGGTEENRVRFLAEILAAIRGTVGPDFPVGVRFSSEDGTDGGLRPKDVAAIARRIESAVDFIDVTKSTDYRHHQMFATMDSPLAYEIPDSEVVTRELSVPTIVTGRIMTLDVASEIIASGAADMVSIVRPLIADPGLIEKARSGRSAQIRPCIGTNQGCVAKVLTTGKVGCSVNPTVGREFEMSFEPDGKAATSKRVLIVGGGPAGLEAARTAALRGHTVELLEMSRQLGGQVAIAASAPHRADMGAITSWLADEVKRLGVKVRLGVPADPELIMAQNPDEVIIAAGSTPRRDGFQASHPAKPIPGAGLRHVYTSWDVFGFGGRAEVGHNVLVHDDTGSYEAISVVEKLIADGHQVTFATRHETVGGTVDFPPATVYPARERMAAAGVEFVHMSYVGEITPDDVELVLAGGTARKRVGADTVVLVGYNEPNRENADELIDAPFPVHLIGDATGTRTVDEAIRQGAELARTI
ncbi:FAD-dependent oxidoreductase [Nocardia sp. NPDC050378]|uniref:oxidoreductase n=1 Tax=Nocardia sp. NPDC050378 TaxID=3155400 RepID=UPI0033D350FD